MRPHGGERGDGRPSLEAPKKRRASIPLVVIAVLALAYGGYRFYESRQPYEWSGTVEARTIYRRLARRRPRQGGARARGRPRRGGAGADRARAGRPRRAAARWRKAQLEQAQATLEKLEKGARPEEIEQARARAQTATRGARRDAQPARARSRSPAAQARLRRSAGRGRQGAARRRARAQALRDAARSRRPRSTTPTSALRRRDRAARRAQAALDELENGSRREEIAQAAARAQPRRSASAKLGQGRLARRGHHGGARRRSTRRKGRLDQIDVDASTSSSIRAPRAARVEALDLRPGDILAPERDRGDAARGRPALRAHLRARDAASATSTSATRCRSSVDSFPERTFKGNVEHINAVGEYSPRNLQTADERADQVFADARRPRRGRGRAARRHGRVHPGAQVSDADEHVDRRSRA